MHAEFGRTNGFRTVSVPEVILGNLVSRLVWLVVRTSGTRRGVVRIKGIPGIHFLPNLGLRLTLGINAFTSQGFLERDIVQLLILLLLTTEYSVQPGHLWFLLPRHD